jgi:glycosyltransferase involved in cell wall biosynthesis
VKKVPKVHVFCEYGNDGTYMFDVATIRLLNPLWFLNDQRKIELTYGGSLYDAPDADIYIVERAWRDNLEQNEIFDLIRRSRALRGRLVFEIDDNLLDHTDVKLQTKNNIRLLARNADLVVVSTSRLRERLLRLNPCVAVIPNTLPRSLLKDVPHPSAVTDMITIGYMGTATHQKDFNMIKLPLLQLLYKYSDRVRLEIVGALSDTSDLNMLPNTKILNPDKSSRYDEFWPWMRANLHWDFGLAPLKTDSFTICKSDIKFLDYAALGISGVFSRHPAYMDTVVDGINGLLAYDTPQAWFGVMERLVLDGDLRERMARSAFEQLGDSRTTESAAHLWEEVLTKLAQ